MDEILIEEKKYISSKRAAKITGYAKDYIGQLCREGRVPARLVGRSWYVLETAIQDHRFGNPEIEILPSKSHLQNNVEVAIPTGEPKEPEFKEQLEDSWRAWFDRFDRSIRTDTPENVVTAEEPAIPVAFEEQKEENKPEMEEDASINVPIHAVYRPIIEEPIPEEMPLFIENEPEERESQTMHQKERKKGKKMGIIKAIQITGACIALIMTVLAVIGSGYFDEYILLSSQARIIAGVGLYNK